jgi:hypothetical protein
MMNWKFDFGLTNANAPKLRMAGLSQPMDAVAQKGNLHSSRWRLQHQQVYISSDQAHLRAIICVSLSPRHLATNSHT